MGVRVRPSRTHEPVRVAVSSDQALVAEAVAAALRTWSFETALVRWPRAPGPAPGVRPRRQLRGSVRPAPDVGLLLSDLTRTSQVHAARLVVGSRSVPWVVMAGTPRGPAWGAMYDGGASLVVPSETGLLTLAGVLEDLGAGRRSPVRRRERRELVELWRSFAAQRKDVAARLETLTDRESEVLSQLHQGVPVRTIAEQSQLAEGTVRSHVKAILKKLDVNSQVAAVAAYEDVLTDAMPRTAQIEQLLVEQETVQIDEVNGMEAHHPNR